MKFKLELPEIPSTPDLMMTAIGTMIKKRLEYENYMVEKILRNYVTPPVKGEITKGKIRWRGLSIARYNGNLVGVIQRNELITADGIKVPFINGVLQDLSVLKDDDYGFKIVF